MSCYVMVWYGMYVCMNVIKQLNHMNELHAERRPSSKAGPRGIKLQKIW